MGRARLAGLEVDWFDRQADLARGGQRVEGRGDDLRGPGPLRVILRLRLQQLGVRQDDAELIVQRVEQLSQLGGVLIHLRASVAMPNGISNGCSFGCGSRQRESMKMRMDPPAVRT